MRDRMNEMFDCRERVKAVLLTYEINPIEQSDLVTDLALLVMNWPHPGTSSARGE